jgi:hypothetical protein
MTVHIQRILTEAERVAMEDEAFAKGWYRNDRRMFTPGMAWFQPWYFDPTGERERDGKHVMIKLENRGRLGFLSQHYWDDWSHKRPPICVVCPNGELWEIDRKSSNGTGWVVTGDLPNITCSPSIVVEGYHGFLRDGLFTADVDGRPPNGVPRPLVERPL